MSNPPLHHFLIVFDHEQEELLRDIETFDDPAVATEAYTATERLYSARDRIEVVLIGSDSLATVEQTHPNYFPGGERFAERVEELLKLHAST